METESRESPRYFVSLRMDCADHESAVLQLVNVSSTGFMARGRLKVAEGDRLNGRITVYLETGERHIGLSGVVASVLAEPTEDYVGVRIEGFDTIDDKTLYQDIMRELETET
jgi:hypothetical protein